jgi:peroxiredoxin Q/BCP
MYGMLAAAGLMAGARDLKVGMPAPLFQAQDQKGSTVRLADFVGQSPVVLYFYPKDGTPGCTKEACSLRDGYQAIQATGAVLLGVSADRVDRHAAFASQYNLPFTLLADPTGKEVIKPYGVWVPVLGIASRVTFIIDKDGIIRDIIGKVDTSGHDKQVLESLRKIL